MSEIYDTITEGTNIGQTTEVIEQNSIQTGHTTVITIPNTDMTQTIPDSINRRIHFPTNLTKENTFQTKEPTNTVQTTEQYLIQYSSNNVENTDYPNEEGGFSKCRRNKTFATEMITEQKELSTSPARDKTETDEVRPTHNVAETTE